VHPHPGWGGYSSSGSARSGRASPSCLASEREPGFLSRHRPRVNRLPAAWRGLGTRSWLATRTSLHVREPRSPREDQAHVPRPRCLPRRPPSTYPGRSEALRGRAEQHCNVTPEKPVIAPLACPSPSPTILAPRAPLAEAPMAWPLSPRRLRGRWPARGRLRPFRGPHGSPGARPEYQARMEFLHGE
jgi:hypothetical protein